MKIEELYHELKEYPELISDRSPAEIKAVLKFAKNQGPIFTSIPKNKKASYDEWAKDYTFPISNKPKNDSEPTFSFYSKNDKRDQDLKYMDIKKRKHWINFTGVRAMETKQTINFDWWEEMVKAESFYNIETKNLL